MKSTLDVIRALLAQPTAPFHEDAVAAEIVALLSECPHVALARDDFGNLIAHYRRGIRRNQPPRWAFAAHMDHPGWVRDKEGQWQFLGGVPKEVLAKQPKRKPFAGGRFAMWDLPAFQLKNDQIHSRACDDLIGCAAIVSMFHQLEASGTNASCLGLFTRAEEVGFVGAMQLAASGLIDPQTVILSLETSAERPPAKMGDGVIVRVGDRTSIFDPEITAALEATASAAKIQYQRCLMPGGTCEATAYALAGYRCGALCVALGNYHNVAPKERIAPEFVSLADANGLADLCTALVRQSGKAAPDPKRALRKRLEANLKNHRPYFRPLGLDGVDLQSE
jgi:endoglucanase